MLWTRISSDPITTERNVAVRCEDGREGCASIRWPGQQRNRGTLGAGPEIYGAVTRWPDPETGEAELLDPNPTFA